MKSSLLICFLFSALVLGAQTAPTRLLCGNDVFSQIVRNNYPDLDAAFRSTFDATQANPVLDRGNTLNINVVVHVVWKEAAENLSDAVIEDQIDVLNRDFNRLNADTADLRAIFAPYAGNPQITFTLAAIERVQTNILFEVSLLGTNLLPEVKHTAQGGSDAWPTENYLNIWVCHIQPISFGGFEVGQILGFAFPPAGLGNWPAGSNSPNADEDGVVIDFRVFGSNNPNTVQIPGGGGSLVVKGRTPVHEVGHYLGLRHIWGDGGILGLPNDCAQSDGIDDTPFADAQSAFDCDKTKNSCTGIEPYFGQDMPDLVENFMDYSSEACQNMFTQGQAGHMVATLNGPRVGLLANVAVKPDPVHAATWTLTPNPTSGRAAITLAAAQEPVTVRILDATGRERSRFQAAGPVIELPTQSMERGCYFVQVNGGGGSSVRRLVVR